MGVPSRAIDPRGHRFGAALSVVVLSLGFLAQVSLVIPAIALALGVGAVFGTRYSILGRPWPFVRRAFGSECVRAELRGLLDRRRLARRRLQCDRVASIRGARESEFPPRFAQLLGTVGLGLASVLLAADLTTGAWLVTAAVGGLQAVLAVTGYCLGCRLYFLRWYAPQLFDRLAGAASRGVIGGSV